MVKCSRVLVATAAVVGRASAFGLPSPSLRPRRGKAPPAVLRPGARGAIAVATSVPRAGALPEGLPSLAAPATPAALFDSALGLLGLSALLLKASDRFLGDRSPPSSSSAAGEETPREVRSMQAKFLAAFWLLRCGYWMSGPYVVPAYKSKVFGGVPASMALVSQIFLTGFAATAILGPSIGQATDRYGRRLGTIACAALYGAGCLSIRSDALWALFVGRAVIGCGLGLLFTAPEAWLNGEAGRTGLTGHLGETFGLAYTGDAVVAIAAGKLASWAASVGGMTSGPFVLAAAFCAAGGLVAALAWGENRAAPASPAPPGGTASSGSSSLREALDIVRGDERLVLVGAVQSLFEAAMYVFILQWPSAVSKAVATAFGAGSATPFGTVFSCFMTCSLLGSLLFGRSLANKARLTETTAAGMLGVSATSMAVAAACTAAESVSMTALLAAFFVYEACVGMYFPAIGTIRSKLIPDDKKSVILSLFGVPLNTLVVLIYLFTGKLLGMTSSLGISAGALAVATGCMLKLRSIARREAGGGVAPGAAAA